MTQSAINGTTAAPDYRLLALPGTVPPKPGLLRDPTFTGAGVDVEVWAMPEAQFGGLVAAVPPPLTIGSLTLDDGSIVKGFLCESAAASSATDITRFGGWTAYLRSQ